MINKIKIWLNRNFIKAFLIIFLVWLIYSFINSLNLHYKEKKEKRQELLGFINASNIEEDDEEEIEEEDLIERAKNSLIQVDKNSEEYKKVFAVINKTINLMYQLSLNLNSDELKKEVYNLLSKRLIIKEKVDINNIEDYSLNIENIQNYSISNINKCKENNNVVSYIVKINHKIGDTTFENIYLIIDMDYNTESFAYDGEIETLDEIPYIEVIDKVERNSTNSFE